MYIHLFNVSAKSTTRGQPIFYFSAKSPRPLRVCGEYPWRTFTAATPSTQRRRRGFQDKTRFSRTWCGATDLCPSRRTHDLIANASREFTVGGLRNDGAIFCI